MGRALVGFLGVWVVARFQAPRLSPAARGRLASTIARRTLAGLGIAVRVRGRRDAARGPCLLVANHVSWLDVQVLNALWDARFVAKSEMRRWPVVGGIAQAFGAFFLRRGHFRDAARVKDAVAETLVARQTVAVFPEATTSDGSSVLRFRHAFFQAALDAGVPVQPVALRYRRADGVPTQAASFVGDMTFLASLRNVLAERTLVVDVAIGAPLAPFGRDRRELAAAARERIATALGLPAGAIDAPALPPRRRAA
jgi:1-acyl-sn-glycerol-3-phosphate acyltransferase